MYNLFKPLFLSLIKPFYKENAGLFLFVIIVMFCIIGKVDGAGLFEYHYSLITGMLQSYPFLFLVFLLWTAYAVKYSGFVSGTLDKPQFAFLHIYNGLPKTRRLVLFFVVEMTLLLPVLLYSSAIIIIASRLHFYLSAVLVISWLLLLSAIPALLHMHRLANLHSSQSKSEGAIKKWPALTNSYTAVLFHFICSQQKMIFTGSKVFTCGILYLIARNNTPADNDTSYAFIFFNFGVLSNALLIHRIRNFEETYLSFYRGTAVSLTKRFLQYALLYAALLVPEAIVIIFLTPLRLPYAVAPGFWLAGYSLLLLMHSITFLQDFKKKEYLKILLAIFIIQYIFLLTAGLYFLSLLFLIISITCFIKKYYTWEKAFRN